MQYAILPMRLGFEPRCSLCRMGQNLAPFKFRDDFDDLYQIKV